MTQREAPPHDYRPEIDGLRAIAVVPVILFHAGLPGLSGGYVGVDIFFVISGYLITNVLLKDIEEKKYSIFTFYERRARRIFPVLFLVLLVSTLLAVWLLFAKELDEYGKSAFAATLFVSNYYFMFDAGYFTGPAETKPLLHTWSLAVEEQFYIFFPIYLYMTARFLRRWGAALTAALVVCSFAYCVWLTNSHADTAFYSAPARAWELLVGSILAIALRGKQFAPAPAQGVGILGLGMIATAVFLYSETTAFPGSQRCYRCWAQR